MNGHMVLKAFEEPNCEGLAGTFVLALEQCIQTSYSGISEMFGAITGSSGFSIVIYSYGNSQCSGSGVKTMTVQYNFNTQCVNDGFGSSSAAITTSAPEFKSGLLTRFSSPPPLIFFQLCGDHMKFPAHIQRQIVKTTPLHKPFMSIEVWRQLYPNMLW